MLIYKILACVGLVCFAAAAYLYVIFQIPHHRSDESAVGNPSKTIDRFWAKTISDN